MAEVIDRHIAASRAPSLEELSSRVEIFSEKLQSIERLIEKDSESKENQINLVKEYFDAKVRKSDDIMKFAQISVWSIIGVAALVAFVGYKSLEDFSKQSESIISSKIDRYVSIRLGEANSSLAQLQNVLGEVGIISQKIKEFDKTFGGVMQDFKNTDLVDYDISGAIERLSDENGKVSKENRKQMLEILRKITEKPYSDMYDSSFYFNAAARASSLDQHGLATKLADIAYEKHKTAVHSVRRIRLKIESGDFQASDEVRKLIVGLTLERPEIVLSEAWNIAEHTSKYHELIEWIEELIRSRPDGGVGENYIPSYTYVILGQLYLRWGVPGSIEKAEDCFRIALELHQKESPMASWYKDTIRDFRDNRKYLEIAREHRKKPE